MWAPGAHSRTWCPHNSERRDLDIGISRTLCSWSWDFQSVANLEEESSDEDEDDDDGDEGE
eukprot:10487681-Alexandrium_andersonii.AAC.1